MNTCCNCDKGGPVPVHPNQLSFVLENCLDLEAYNNGYETGLNWDANWRPGGPMTYYADGAMLHPNTHNYALKQKVRVESNHRSLAWHEGFTHGLAIRLQTNAHFRRWYEASRLRGGDLRYTAPQPQEVATS